MMPELKMIANGFALKHAKDEQVEESISELNTAMIFMYYSEKLNMAMNTIKSEFSSGLYDISEDSNISIIDFKDMSGDDIESVLIAEEANKNYQQKQLDLVKEYKLPYIVNNTTQSLSYSSTMKGSGGKNNGVKPAKQRLIFRALDNWNWFDGDFFWVDGAKGIGHVGLIEDRGGRNLAYVYDSMPGEGIQKHIGLSNYANKPTNSGWTEYTNNSNLTYSNINNIPRNIIINYAKSMVGKSTYSLFVGKDNKNETYCSSFVWQSYKKAGIDLDTNKGLYVWPRDLTKHKKIKMFNAQKRVWTRTAN